MVQKEVKAKQLRSFGLMVGGIFAFIGLWPVVYRGSSPRVWALILAALLIFPALVYPKSLRLVYQNWMKVGQVLGWINTRIILSLIFYLLFFPVRIVLRLLGKDPMNRHFDSDSATYRVIRHPRPGSHMKHQF